MLYAQYIQLSKKRSCVTNATLVFPLFFIFFTGLKQGTQGQIQTQKDK